MILIKQIILSTVCSLFLLGSYASDFEGNFTLVKESLYDTSYFTFSVKAHLVRIDERDSHQQILQSIIVNTATKNITALSPALKLYTTIDKHRQTVIASEKEFTCIKSNNFKYINGFKCYQWRLRNPSINTDISYWVFDGEFDSLSKVYQLLGETDDYSKYCLFFNQIPQNTGYFPMVMVERTLLRDEKLRVSLQNMENKKINDQVFCIPKDYKLLKS